MRGRWGTGASRVRPRRSLSLLVLTSAAVVGGGTLAAPVATAAVAANGVSRSLPVASASWGAVATLARSGPTGYGPLVLTGGLLGGQGLVYIDSTGSIGLSGQTYSVTVAGSVLPSATLTICSTGYTATYSCSGTVTTVDSSSSPQPVNAALPLAVGGQQQMLLTVNGISLLNLVVPQAVTIGVSVGPAQVRGAGTVNA